jgi:hypothetical protein
MELDLLEFISENCGMLKSFGIVLEAESLKI